MITVCLPLWILAMVRNTMFGRRKDSSKAGQTQMAPLQLGGIHPNQPIREN
jgi:hypothetical protein